MVIEAWEGLRRNTKLSEVTCLLSDEGYCEGYGPESGGGGVRITVGMQVWLVSFELKRQWDRYRLPVREGPEKGQGGIKNPVGIDLGRKVLELKSRERRRRRRSLGEWHFLARSLRRTPPHPGDNP